MQEFENFLPDPNYVREYALAQKFIDLNAYDGEMYKRVALVNVPGLVGAIEEKVGQILMLGQGFRLNFSNEKPNNPVHIDTGWGTHALVLYLSEHPNPEVKTGTAFFSSTEEGAEMIDFCQEKFNKAVIYRSDQPHSRWPLEAYGDNARSGRLVAVAFFTPFSEFK